MACRRRRAENGAFKLEDVPEPLVQPLEVNASAYPLYRRDLGALFATGGNDVGDILLWKTTSQPVITAICSDVNGWFLPGVGIMFNATVEVDWNGHAAGEVQFFGNDQLIQAVNVADPGGGSSSYSALVDVDQFFAPTTDRNGNLLGVSAVAGNGVSSDRLFRKVNMLPMPEALARVLSGGGEFELFGDYHHGTAILIPPKKLEKTVDLPALGKFGIEAQASATFDILLNTGEWEIGIPVGRRRGERSSSPSRFKFLLGVNDFEINAGGFARGRAMDGDLGLKSLGVFSRCQCQI